MSKIFTLAAYFFQSIAALILVLCVSRILPAHEYSQYSLAIATSQAMAIAAFEWVRLAATRFYPAEEETETRRKLASLWFSFICGTGVLAVIAVVVGVLDHRPVAAALIFVIALLQGGTDLQLTLTRFRGNLTLFSQLQCARATLLIIGALWGAKSSGVADGGLLGLTISYVAAAVLFAIVDMKSLQVSLSDANRQDLVSFLRYGTTAAGASTLHLIVPLVLRWGAARLIGLTDFAGFALAMDLMQRPFSTLITALQGIVYPPVVSEHRREHKGPRPALFTLYELHLVSVLLTMGGCLAFIPQFGQLFAPANFRDVFLQSAPWATVLFAMHAVLQNTVGVAAHLARRASRLVVNAVVELITVSGGAALAVALLGAKPAYIFMGAAGGVAVSLAIAAPIVTWIECRPPWRSALFAALAAAGMAATMMFDVHSLIWNVAFKSVVAGVLCVLSILLGNVMNVQGQLARLWKR
jgi:O-antigen/teichoic acid export membrane protein